MSIGWLVSGGRSGKILWLGHHPNPPPRSWLDLHSVQCSNADVKVPKCIYKKIVKFTETFIMLVLLFLLTFSYLESDSNAEIL
jgi:hypothetical protein